jgi:valyl-tRNA synthetase
MTLVIEIITRLRNIRASFSIAPSLPLTAEIAATDENSRAVIEAMQDHIKRLARIESLYIVDQLGSARGTARAVISGAEIAVPLEGLVDFDKERARLEKDIAKLSNELIGLEKRLGNADFIARAAAEVVAASRERAAELNDQIAKLQSTIEAL